jgi:hypothetical protein
MKVPLGRSCLAAVVLLLAMALRADAGALVVVDWFPEPAGSRAINQPEVAGVLRNDSNNMDVTQTFTVTSSGALAAVGFAIGFPDGTPSLTLSLYRVSGGLVQAAPFATSFLPREYFENIGPQTIPIWAYAGFSSGTTEVTAGEKIAFRIQSPFAQLWGPRSDALPGAELVGFPGVPGEDMAFRVYTIPEPAAGTMLMGSALCLLLASSRPTQPGERARNLGEPFRILPS